MGAPAGRAVGWGVGGMAGRHPEPKGGARTSSVVEFQQRERQARAALSPSLSLALSPTYTASFPSSHTSIMKFSAFAIFMAAAIGAAAASSEVRDERGGGREGEFQNRNKQ